MIRIIKTLIYLISVLLCFSISIIYWSCLKKSNNWFYKFKIFEKKSDLLTTVSVSFLNPKNSAKGIWNVISILSLFIKLRNIDIGTWRMFFWMKKQKELVERKNYHPLVSKNILLEELNKSVQYLSLICHKYKEERY